MRNPVLVAFAACVVLSIAVFVGSTGLGYAVYRPLRYYDIFSLVVAWAGFAFHVWRDRARSGQISGARHS